MADKMTIVQISMPISQYYKLRNAAGERGLSMAKIVRDALDKELDSESVRT